MIDTPQIIQTTPLTTARIHLTLSREEMPKVFGACVGELIAGIQAQGIQPVGPIFTHHLRRPADTFDFDLCVPVATPVAAAGRIQPGEWPAMRVARTIYRGPYEGLAEGWGEFMDWIEKNDHREADDLYECYVTGPHSDPDPATWQTELSRPLASGNRAGKLSHG